MPRSKTDIENEIEARNMLRVSVGLTTLSVADEMARMRKAETCRDFLQWSEPLREQIVGEVLAEIRQQKADQTWLPRGPLNGGWMMMRLVQQRLRRRIWLEQNR